MGPVGGKYVKSQTSADLVRNYKFEQEIAVG